MSVVTKKQIGKQKLKILVEKFAKNETDYLNQNYNETQARTEFITPFLEALGWDVNNTKGLSGAYREVVEEANVNVADSKISKRPDYELRLAKQRKLFVEAKKPSINIAMDSYPAFQTRRYGYSASFPISILTNFHETVIYDCCHVPKETDNPAIGRILLIKYTDLEDRFDELWDKFSREAVYSGNFDKEYKIDTTRRGAEQFDDYFLSQIKNWRMILAKDINKNCPTLTSEELTYTVQLFISRLIFLRICEDREIEKYETLKELSDNDTYTKLRSLLKRSDEFYNSGLFNIVQDECFGTKVSDSILWEIILDLYYPNSPYTFSVIEAEVLGEIYEQFLGEIISFVGDEIKIEYKPEVRESDGVVPTPKFIADIIVSRTIKEIENKSPDELDGFYILDTCCGSGIFLLSSYTFLLDHYLEYYSKENPDYNEGKYIYRGENNTWKLSFSEKRRILTKHIRGVDIDSNAVEVARLSLLLKLIEDENKHSLDAFVSKNKCPALPDLEPLIKFGNSLVSGSEWHSVMEPMTPEQHRTISPFEWSDEFPNEMESGGFDAIVGNPPYIRIQKMVQYSPDEISYYKSKDSPYFCAQKDNFDKYSLFIERSVKLSKQNGKIGLIVPSKFMTIKSGESVRTVLSKYDYLSGIVNFGTQSVFGKDILNYTSIITLDKEGCKQVEVETPGPIETWRYQGKGHIEKISSDLFTGNAWQLTDAEVRELFDKIRATHANTLKEPLNNFPKSAIIQISLTA